MTDIAQPDALNKLRNEFDRIVESYNNAIETGKVRTIRPAAVVAHKAIFALSLTVRTSYPDQGDLLSKIEAAFTDVRFGRLVEPKPL